MSQKATILKYKGSVSDINSCAPLIKPVASLKRRNCL